LVELETKAKLVIQQMIVDGKLGLVTSYMLEQENDDNPYAERRNTIMDFFKYAHQDISETQEIIKMAKEANATGLKVKDSIHVACAIFADCEYLLTTDNRFLKYKDARINVVNPIQFLVETEGV